MILRAVNRALGSSGSRIVKLIDGYGFYSSEQKPTFTYIYKNMNKAHSAVHYVLGMLLNEGYIIRTGKRMSYGYEVTQKGKDILGLLTRLKTVLENGSSS